MIIDGSKTGDLIQMVVKGKESSRQRKGKVGRNMQLVQHPSGSQDAIFIFDA